MHFLFARLINSVLQNKSKKLILTQLICIVVVLKLQFGINYVCKSVVSPSVIIIDADKLAVVLKNLHLTELLNGNKKRVKFLDSSSTFLWSHSIHIIKKLQG